MSENKDCGCKNVGDIERFFSAVSGAAMVIKGLRRRSLYGLGIAALGASSIYRGVSGNCMVYKALGISTNGTTTNKIIPTIGAQPAGVVAESMGMGSEVSVGGMSPSGDRIG